MDIKSHHLATCCRSKAISSVLAKVHIPKVFQCLWMPLHCILHGVDTASELQEKHRKTANNANPYKACSPVVSVAVLKSEIHAIRNPIATLLGSNRRSFTTAAPLRQVSVRKHLVATSDSSSSRCSPVLQLCLFALPRVHSGSHGGHMCRFVIDISAPVPRTRNWHRNDLDATCELNWVPATSHNATTQSSTLSLSLSVFLSVFSIFLYTIFVYYSLYTSVFSQYSI